MAQSLNPLKYKYFHNSVGWSGLYLQVYIASLLAKISKFTVSILLENFFVKLPPPLGMI